MKNLEDKKEIKAIKETKSKNSNIANNSNITNTANNTNSEIWLAVSEAANLAGVNDKTIRRALKESNLLVYKITKDRYKIELKSLINYMNLNTKLNNKFLNYGLGQYVDNWKNL